MTLEFPRRPRGRQSAAAEEKYRSARAAFCDAFAEVGRRESEHIATEIGKPAFILGSAKSIAQS
jgi:hypothetical protein